MQGPAEVDWFQVEAKDAVLTEHGLGPRHRLFAAGERDLRVGINEPDPTAGDRVQAFGVPEQQTVVRQL